MEKFTFVEPHLHFDGAQFGPSHIGGGDDADETLASDPEGGTDDGSGRSGSRVAGMILASLVLSVVATVAARRLFGSDDGGAQATLDLDVGTDAPAPEQ